MPIVQITGQSQEKNTINAPVEIICFNNIRFNSTLTYCSILSVDYREK